DGAMKAVVIRAGDFFGGGRGTWLDLVMAKDLARGKFTYPGPLDVPTAWAFLPDLARAFVAVAERRHELPAFQTLHFAGHALTGQDWASAAEAIAKEQGWVRPGAALRVDSLSWPVLRMLALVMPTMASVCEMRYLWHTPYALANDRLLGLIGAEPRTPLAAALRAALADLDLLAPVTSDSVPATLALR
ncbi:MAG: epimerase, partial [Ramlibacter sp.]